MRHALFFPLLLAACFQDETISGFTDAGTTWNLTDISGNPFTAGATITFPEQGRIAGNAPCNQYFGSQTVPYPWFRAEAIGSTKRACPELKQETEFLATLGRMTLVEVSGSVLILSNDDGETMEFQADIE